MLILAERSEGNKLNCTHRNDYFFHMPLPQSEFHIRFGLLRSGRFGNISCCRAMWFLHRLFQVLAITFTGPLVNHMMSIWWWWWRWSTACLSLFNSTRGIGMGYFGGLLWLSPICINFFCEFFVQDIMCVREDGYDRCWWLSRYCGCH